MPVDVTEIVSDGPVDRGSLLSELEKMPAQDASEEVPVGEEPAATKPEAEAAAPTEEPVEEESEEVAQEAAPAEEKPDEATEKRLAAVRAEEKKAKAAIAQERAKLDAERRELSVVSERLKQFETLARRAKYDPAGVLTALGLSDSDLELAARQVYARSPEAQKDPKHAESTAREMRDREAWDRLERLERQNQELISQIQSSNEQAVIERQAQAYMATVVKSVSTETPLVRTMLEKNPEKTQARLAQVAQSLVETTGEIPDHVDVVRELEKQRKDELEELGIDVSAFKAPSKNQPQNAGEKKAARTLSNDLSTPTKPRSAPRNSKEERSMLLKELETLE